MMKLKRTSISSEEAKAKALAIADIERKLVPRMKAMAYLFFALSLVSLAFAFFVHEEQDQTPALSLYREENSFLLDIEAIMGATLFTDMEALELSPQDIFNFYAVSGIFTVIGICLFQYSTKKRGLLPNSMADSKIQLGE
jgi:hypothetical protein